MLYQYSKDVIKNIKTQSRAAFVVQKELGEWRDWTLHVFSQDMEYI